MNKTYTRCIFLLILYLSLSGIVSAFPLNNYFRHYTINDGLSNNAVYNIFQDSNGMMWFGTIDGLHKFDGRRIHVIRPSSPEVAGNLIYAINEDDRKCLWIGSDAGLSILNLETDEYRPFLTATKEGTTIVSRIGDIYKDSHKNMWIATAGQGLFCFNPTNGELSQFLHQLPSREVKDIIEDRTGIIWITTLDNGICSYNLHNNDFKHYDDSIIKNGLILFEDSHATIWLGNAGNGLFRLNRQTNCFEQVIHPKSDRSVLQIRSIIEPEPGILLLASDEGLMSYNTTTGLTETIRSTPDWEYGLNDNYLHSLFIDREKGIWIGTYFGGVNYLSPTAGNFTLYNYKNIPINGKIISAFASDEQQNLWIGTDDAGFYYWNRSNNSFTGYAPNTNNSNGPTYQNIHALLPDGDRLYIGMYMGGLDIFDLRTGRFRNYQTSESSRSLCSSGVYSLHKDIYGKLWVGTSLGLNLYCPESDDFERIPELHGSDVTCILEDQKGFLWAMTLGNGIFRLNRKTGKWHNYRHDPKNADATLPINKIVTACTDNNQCLWVGTDGGGLCMYDYVTDCFVPVDLPGTPSMVIYKIIPDNGLLWISTSNGLLRYQPEQKTLKVYNKYDGLQDNQFSPNAGVKMADGTLFFGGISGFNGFHPTEMVQNNQMPKIVFTDFMLFNKHVTPGEPGSPLSRSITYTDRLVLKKQHSIFSISFAALSYTSTQKNRYKYKLEGFEKEWTEVRETSYITYTNLPAGEYIFHVCASNGDGIWNEEGISLPIRVLPPLWRSLPFLIGYLLLVACLAFYSVYRIRRQHCRKLKRLESEKEKELYDTKINFFTSIVHEIRTPLTLILAPLENVMRSKGKVSDVMPQLQVVERNGKRLLNLVNQLMDFRKVEEGGIKMNWTVVNLCPLLEEIYKRFQLSAELKNIETALVLPELPECYANIDTEAFTKIVSNLLSNALKFTTDKIWIALIADKKNGEIELHIRDNGNGIDASEQQNIFKPFYQVQEDCPSDHIGTGIGLLLVKKLVHLLHGELKLQSQTGAGSLFIIRLTLVEPTAEETAHTPTDLQESVQSIENKEKKQGNTLLLVDDNEDMLNFLKELFEPIYNVVAVTNGEVALEETVHQPFDLVISDVMMPRMDGFELCSRIKSNLQTSHIPVLLLTAKVGTEDRIEGFENGADAYVEKPFSADVLKAQVQSLLLNRKRARGNFVSMPMTPAISVANSKMDETFLQRMADIIEANMTNPDFTVETLARELCMGRSNFFAKVKGVSDMTPNDFIRISRLKKAAALFHEGESCISDVCFRVGFSSPSYFAKCFQLQFGLSPTEFLRKRSK